ncbi:hypothetical protein Hanom_Chr06g00573191 [Helianthus anomalus]
MAREEYFRIPDRVSRKVKLHEGLKDLNIRFLHMDHPLQITNGTRREKRTNGPGYRYALTCWKKFMKAAQIKVRDQVHYSFDENEQVLIVESVVPYIKRSS